MPPITIAARAVTTEEDQLANLVWYDDQTGDTFPSKKCKWSTFRKIEKKLNNMEVKSRSRQHLHAAVRSVVTPLIQRGTYKGVGRPITNNSQPDAGVWTYNANTVFSHPALTGYDGVDYILVSRKKDGDDFMALKIHVA